MGAMNKFWLVAPRIHCNMLYYCHHCWESQANYWYLCINIHWSVQKQFHFQWLLIRTTLKKSFGLHWKTVFYAVKSLWFCNDQYTFLSEISTT